MDQTVTATVGDLIVVLIWAGTVVAAWYAGGYYKTRRKEGLSKEEIKTMSVDQAKAWFSVVLKEIQALKDKQ